MLLPVLQSVSLWWTPDKIECHAVRFHGGMAEGFRALSIAIKEGLPVDSLRRVWPLVDGEPTGPSWELTFTG